MCLDCFISACFKVTSDFTQWQEWYQDHVSLPDTCRDSGCPCDDLQLAFPVHCHFLSLPHISFFPGRFLCFQMQGSFPPYLPPWNVNHYSMPRITMKLEQRLLSKPPRPVHIILLIATLLRIHTALHSLLFWPNQKIIPSFPKWTPFLFFFFFLFLFTLLS